MIIRSITTRLGVVAAAALFCLPSVGCMQHQVGCNDGSHSGILGHHGARGPKGYAAFGPSYDRPFPLGQVTDSFWETQQTNAEAADFIFHDHEFVEDTALLGPSAKRHLEQVALRLEHVPFPIVIERTEYDRRPEMDEARRRMIVEQLARMGVPNAGGRVVISETFAEGITALEAEQAYYRTLSTRNGGGGGGFGGAGGGATFR
jgi:hypothetical protein